jgi:hypothetical protein
MKNSNDTIGNRTRDLPACGFNQLGHHMLRHFKGTQQKLSYNAWDRRTLTFKNRASYIEDGHTATLQMLHFIYFFEQM